MAADTEAAESNEKALKYHAVLVNRPSSGYLFDRFFGVDDRTRIEVNDVGHSIEEVSAA